MDASATRHPLRLTSGSPPHLLVAVLEGVVPLSTRRSPHDGFDVVRGTDHRSDRAA